MKEGFIPAVKKLLHRRGCKLTGQRLAILSYLDRERGHPGVREIYEGIRAEYPGIGMATVYRTVDLFLEIGLLRAITLKKDQLRYELHRPGDHHHHLICTSCGKISEFGSCNFKSIAAEIEEVTRFRIEDHTLEVYGQCSHCLKESAAYSTEKI